MNSLTNLKFDRKHVPWKPVSVLIAIVIMSIAQWLLNPNTFFWFSLVVVGILVWVANYGWRQALITLIYFLNRLLSDRRIS